MEGAEQRPPHLAMVCTPGMGHITPLLEFAKRLVSHYNFQVTLIVTNDGSPMKSSKQLLQSLPTSISSIFLPPVSFADLPENSKAEIRIFLSLIRSLPALGDACKVLAESTRLVALVGDLFCGEAIDVAEEVGAPFYIFFPTTAMSLSLVFHLPKLDETYSCEYRDLPEPVNLPGCVPLPGRDLPLPARKDIAYQGFLKMDKLYRRAAGILVDSFIDLEPGVFQALMESEPGRPPIYPVGPLVKTESSVGDDRSECLRWLGEQPSGSVLFVCFGSGGTLSHEQLNELAFGLGLELSRQRFLWVVKTPDNKAANASYFGEQTTDENPLDFLPNGFLDRTKGLGLVVPSWAPQAQILSHDSTGGFLTHCGWNSTLESIVHGIPLIAWPLYSEQKMNSVLLADDLKVALRVKANANGVVGRDDITRFARALMEGEEGKVLRSKTRELKEAASRALGKDGSSTASLDNVVRILKNQTP